MEIIYRFDPEFTQAGRQDFDELGRSIVAGDRVRTLLGD
jgi:hypothetical protein